MTACVCVCISINGINDTMSLYVWKKVLLVYLSDFWLMTFFLGMWEIYTWGDYMFYEEFDDDYEPLDAL